ncbi:MAG: EAL domain-containing protein [Actinomycetia bacterium]|nr:EAL domain-containing protein [Actinomycetes bacterium]
MRRARLPMHPADIEAETVRRNTRRRRMAARGALIRRTFAASSSMVFASGCLAALLTIWVAATFDDDVPIGLMLILGGTTASISGTTAYFQRHLTGRTHRQIRDNEHHANHDDLTGLPNRVGLLRELEDAVHDAVRERTVVGVLFLDLNRFKVINDTLGHDVGDELLQRVGERIQESVRANDVVARFGGDEFVVVCRGLLEEDSVTQVAIHILKAFQGPIRMGSGDHFISPSIGIAVSTQKHPHTPRELVRDADSAMYLAKRRQTGYELFDEEQRLNALDRVDTERVLRDALETSALDVHYQAITNARTGRVQSAEALVRLDRPGMGLIAPDRFLDVAEEAGLMAELGVIVLREACSQVAQWKYGNPELAGFRIGVNVAERQLIDPGFASQVAEVLQFSGLEPSDLTLEITEDLVVEHLGALTVLEDLKDFGVSLAIDDFGTGRSSLSYVKKLQMIDYLKIDKTLVQGVGTDHVDNAILDAIVSMAEALNMTIIAEGVETVEQRDHLLELGVEHMQGYLFHRPAPGTDFADQLEKAAMPGRPSPVRPSSVRPSAGDSRY